MLQHSDHDDTIISRTCKNMLGTYKARSAFLHEGDHILIIIMQCLATCWLLAAVNDIQMSTEETNFLLPLV